jgi:hypothetical protein
MATRKRTKKPPWPKLFIARRASRGIAKVLRGLFMFGRSLHADVRHEWGKDRPGAQKPSAPKGKPMGGMEDKRHYRQPDLGGAPDGRQLNQLTPEELTALGFTAEEIAAGIGAGEVAGNETELQEVLDATGGGEHDPGRATFGGEDADADFTGPEASDAPDLGDVGGEAPDMGDIGGDVGGGEAA